MKTTFFISIIVLAFVSCQKRKEIKEWKDRSGSYFSTENHIIYEGTDTLIFNEVEINASGLSLYSPIPNSPSVNFGVFHKSYNENTAYEYAIKYSSLTWYAITPEGVTNPQIPFEEFTQGREFYLSFEGNNLTFTIIDSDGEISNLLFTK